MPFHLSLQSILQQKIKEHFSTSVNNLEFHSIAGGNINKTYKIISGKQLFFCKINSAFEFPLLFKKEKAGLNLIRQQHGIKVPEIIDCFEADNHQILLLEWIAEGEKTEKFWKKFAEQLAILHKISNESFGLPEDNYMGCIKQINKPSFNWINFFIEQRLEPLLKQCTDKKLLTTRHQNCFENLYHHLPAIFEGEQKPSFVHGDLWTGNFMCNQNSEPVLIDPAVYFGHSSIDLGMTTLFGGFSPLFYEAYSAYSPFPKNYKEQWKVCNLYPLLIHLLLFGKTYLLQIEQSLYEFQ